MTLKLVADNVAELPVGNLMDIAAMARRFADDLDKGEHGEPFRAVLLVQREDGLALFGWGESASPLEMMGLFEAAKLQVFADHMNSDD
jgi:hypothetical protein